MSMISELVSKRMEKVDSEIQALKYELEKLKDEPEGFLRISKQNGHCRYYQCQKGDKTGKYLRKSQIDTAKALAQKEYNVRVLKLLQKEKAYLEKLHQFYSMTNKMEDKTGEHFFAGPKEQIWRSMREERRRLITPVIPDDEVFREMWLSEEYEKKPFREDAPEYYTDRGIRVRSKSELIIAGMLEKAGIPFYYEKPLKVRGEEKNLKKVSTRY